MTQELFPNLIQVGSTSPWGTVERVRPLASGIERIYAGGEDEGGYFLSEERNTAMPSVLRIESGWYHVEDEWARVALAYPDYFSELQVKSAIGVFKHEHPDLYEAWSGKTLGPGESKAKDHDAFIHAHADDWLVVSAWGAWDSRVPDGWVGGLALPGRLVSGTRDTEERASFLVPADEYRRRTENPSGYFVIDPARHPVWDMHKPKADQVLVVQRDDEPELDEGLSEGMRP